MTTNDRPSLSNFGGRQRRGSDNWLGQLGGLRLIAHHVDDDRRAEGNAALNISAYVPAAVLTVVTGYAVSEWGIQPAVTTLAATLATLALLLGTAAYRSNTGN